METYSDFKDKLDQAHKWPTIYMFKFVVPKSRVDEFNQLFKQESLQSKESKAGNYLSFTMKKMMSSSQEVVDIYVKAKKIDGLIAL